MRRGRPLIAIVGRPNVGKSTLFNRMIRSKRAIVEDEPGVTRDRHYADCELENVPVTIVDTGGFVPDSKESPLAKYIRQQAQAAVEECDVVLFVVDARTGPTAADQEVANFLRKSSKPVILLVNKTDGRRDAEPVELDGQPGLFRHVGERTVPVVPVERGIGRRSRAAGKIPGVDQQDVLPAVVIEIQEGAARSECLGQILLAECTVVVLEANAGGGRDVGSDRGRGRSLPALRRGSVALRDGALRDPCDRGRRRGRHRLLTGWCVSRAA